jgi:hypothetical protein
MGAAMNAPVQLCMFDVTTPSSSPIGLEVITPKPCRGCGSAIAIVGSSKGPHRASVACRCCGSHRGWLSGETFQFLSDAISIFREPVVIRHNQSAQKRG